MNITEEDIRERAHRLWEADGRPEGQSDHYWFRAREMLAEGRAQGGPAFRPVDAAEAPPEPIEGRDPDAGFPAPSDDGGIVTAERPPLDPAIDPNVLTDPGQGGNAPISEIDTIRRTLEVPKSRRGRGSPTDDRTGAMSGRAGTRQRS
ncbi:DUF2934 domain-containing protein [Ancylobacter dichloromethanicus]|uniref:DUF2934 domain-containing protein n=1 Tax=Ancylobacter dichloromethanicus TaxID=518825 RepID=A0A9W6JDY0_9HYPH|nr:DUF2934 domain-containing protein [Ancylobacter dichloromethanicus]MBS7552233.1 DUF2934 domain-containing protein [Ancylobacter dichloromethanicus]GLK73969.1 hypothetical protein GCM10017643_40870 [Ancylobacter dichloromethanicus]